MHTKYCKGQWITEHSSYQIFNKDEHGFYFERYIDNLSIEKVYLIPLHKLNAIEDEMEYKNNNPENYIIGEKYIQICHYDSEGTYDSYCSYCSRSSGCYSLDLILEKDFRSFEELKIVDHCEIVEEEIKKSNLSPSVKWLLEYVKNQI